MATLEVCDNGEPVSISFADLLKYHGTSSIGGVAHGYKVLERALPLLANGVAPERYEISIETAFPGPGARDAFEMVTRAVTGGRYVVAEELASADVPEAPEGRYFFRLAYRGTVVDLAVRPGLVSDEFIALVRKQGRSQDEEAQVTAMKHEMADRLMAMAAEEVYDAKMR